VSEKTLSRVLYVEDEPDIRTIAEVALQAFGGLKCRDGRLGAPRRSARPRPILPDLILLDVMMPGLSGPTTLERLRADPATAAVPVIFMTAKVQPHEIAEYKTLGALDVIPKPFDPVTRSPTP